MTHTIHTIDHYVAGDTLIINYSVDTPVGTSKDIRNASIDWELLANGYTMLDDTDAGVTVEITDGINGYFTVEIDSGVTSNLAGTHTTRVTLRDAANNQQTWHGNVHIEAR